MEILANVSARRAAGILCAAMSAIYLVAFIGGLLIWWHIGCFVLAWVDKDDLLLNWVKRGPWYAWMLVVTLWPIVVWKFKRG